MGLVGPYSPLNVSYELQNQKDDSSIANFPKFCHTAMFQRQYSKLDAPNLEPV